MAAAAALDDSSQAEEGHADEADEADAEDTGSDDRSDSEFTSSSRPPPGAARAPAATVSFATISSESGRRGRLSTNELVEFRRSEGEAWVGGSIQQSKNHGRVTLCLKKEILGDSKKVKDRRPASARRHAKGRQSSTALEEAWLTLEEQALMVRRKCKAPALNQHVFVQFMELLGRCTPCDCEHRQKSLMAAGARGSASGFAKSGRRFCCSPLKPPMCQHCSGTCECAWIRPIRGCLESGLDINGTSFRGESPMLLAVRTGKVRILLTLLCMSADAHQSQDKHAWTPLHEAAKLGRTDVCEMILDFAAAESPQPGLEESALLGKRAVSAAGLASAEDLWGASPLLEAAGGGFAEIVAVLIKRRANLMARNQTGHTPLMTAAAQGAADVCKLLLEAKCEVCCGEHPGKLGMQCRGKCDSKDHYGIQNRSGMTARRLATQEHNRAKFEGPQRQYHRSSATVLLFEEYGVK